MGGGEGGEQTNKQTKNPMSVDRLEQRSSSVARTRKGYRQPDERWNRFKQTFGEASERRGGAHMAFSERTDTTLH